MNSNARLLGFLVIALAFELSILSPLARADPDPHANSLERHEGTEEPNRGESTPPHILLIVADDLGWNDVGFHGSEIATPNLDRIARQGIELDRFYVQPSCSPTRAALMTGKSPARLGIVRPIAKNDPTGLPIEEKILPERLHDVGYQTFMVGKWHLGHVEKRYFPHRRGFDHFYGHVTGGIGYWDHNHGGGHDWQRDGVTVREQGYTTTLITNEAISLLAARDTRKPAFLYVAYNAPHLPNEAPAEAVARYASTENVYRRVHSAMVSELDRQVGRLLEALEANGMRDDTLIWFTSDNGGLNRATSSPAVVALSQKLAEIFGEPLPIAALEFMRANALEGGADNRPLRGGKMSVYDGGARVPAAIWWPGHLEAGRSERFVTAQDVLPTLLQVAGGEPSALTDLDGRSQLAALADAKVDSSESTSVYLTVGLDGSALYRGAWKLVLPESPLPFSKAPPELYQIRDDPLEQTDLATSNPWVVDQMVEIVDAWPRGPSVHGSLFDVLRDPDRFGGTEDREPWADAAR